MNIYLRLLKYIKPYWLRLSGAILSAVGVSLLTAANAWLVKPVLDNIFIRKDALMLTTLPVIIFLIALFKGIFTYTQAYLMRYTGNKVIKDIRDELYSHIILMPMSFYGKRHTGKIIARIINDVSIIQSAVSTVVKDILQQSITIIALLCVIFYQNWRWAIISIIVLPLGYYPFIKLSKRLRKISRVGQQKIADITSFLHETIVGIKVVKAFGMEKFEKKRFQEKNMNYFKNTMKATRVSEMTSPLMGVIGAIGAAFVIWYGGYEVIKGTTTPGTFFSFMTACLFMYTPMRNLSQANNMIQMALASAERIFSIFDEENEREIDKGETELQRVKHSILFKNVSFEYENKIPVLTDINLNVKSGEVVAVVGSSGSGKTTLVNLLLRFYEPVHGTIFIDDINIKDVPLSSLRRQIGIVSQETILFDDTVRNNIAYGMKDINMEEIIEAAKASYAYQFIINMPNGFDTVIGERGTKLSGGERQRLAIARALLKDPPILILDEATSSLDTESEHIIQKALANLMKNRTTFVIAHRLSTIKHATKIVVIEKGSISEIGRHDELIRHGKRYKMFYDMQFEETARLTY
ncbi:MAG: lipid A export permease/ATP-binding protein MsbA [Nitrospirota bacterium]